MQDLLNICTREQACDMQVEVLNPCSLHGKSSLSEEYASQRRMACRFRAFLMLLVLAGLQAEPSHLCCP